MAHGTSAASDSPEGALATPFGRLVTIVIVAALPAALTVFFASLVPEIAAGQVLRWAVPWIPGLDIEFSFLADGLSLLFSLLISGIGVVVMVYAAAYMQGYPQVGRFFIIMTLFMLSMLGAVLADNVLTLFVFWELTTLTSYFLIGFTHETATSRAAALQALLVTGIGGLAMLAGLVLLGLVGDSYELSVLRASGVDVTADPLYGAILVLVLLGAFAKSAQFPFHFWLPNAMAAPTPVSAYLHSATMVKLGIYLMARMQPLLGGTEAWLLTLTIVGGITAVMSSVWSLRQTDLKQLLAYTTVMGLGTLTLFLGLGTEAATTAAIAFLIIHCFYKATLFLAVGAIDHATHTRDRDALSGLARVMPLTFGIALAAGLSMAGVPPFLGFIGKELMYEAAVTAPSAAWLVAGAALAANALMIAAAGLVALQPFVGRARDWPQPPHDPPVAMWIGPIVLAIAGLVLGLAPHLIDQRVIAPAVAAVAGHDPHLHLKLWHGFNLPLLLSVVTVAAGIGLYVGRERVRCWLGTAERLIPGSAERAYDHALAGLKRLAAWQTALLQHGQLRGYLTTIFGTMIVLIAAASLRGGVWPTDADLTDAPAFAWFASALIIAGSVITIITRYRLAAICALGAVGIGTAILFVSHGAVDVALTQLLVDTLFVVLLAVALLKLPSFWDLRHRETGLRVGAAAIAVAVGSLMTMVLLVIVSVPLDRRLTAYFESNSVPLAHGHNIVNVILVDFRALDTLGEISVVAVAGLAAYALIKLRPRRDPTHQSQGRSAADQSATG